jgi:proteasome lid subunit RPN8/RPN11
MSFSIRSLIAHLFARPPELAIPSDLWVELISGLRERGRFERESGAFLLGGKTGPRVVRSVVFYDEIDPHAFDHGICIIDGSYMADLWKICRERGETVLADVHTHPGASYQSESDRLHPMIAEPGHIALIIARFAANPVSIKETGFYRYLGEFRWSSLPSTFFRPTLHIQG